jgi:hypothetical protein
MSGARRIQSVRRIPVYVLVFVALLLAACGGTTPTATIDAPTAATSAPTATVRSAAPSAATPGASGSTPSPRAASPATPANQPTPISRTGGAQEVILSTTTSTQDSGLLEFLIPRFEAQTGYRVKTVAVGSGAAIALGQRGEADLVLAHAPDNERQFVASGAGIERKLVMYNDFIIVGPIRPVSRAWPIRWPR